MNGRSRIGGLLKVFPLIRDLTNELLTQLGRRRRLRVDISQVPKPIQVLLGSRNTCRSEILLTFATARAAYPGK